MFDIGRLHGSTCGGSELGCAVAMKVLEITTRLRQCREWSATRNC